MNDELFELARVGYDAYCVSVGGVAFNGDRLPEFKDVPDKIQQAWMNAAVAIKVAVR